MSIDVFKNYQNISTEIERLKGLLRDLRSQQTEIRDELLRLIEKNPEGLIVDGVHYFIHEKPETAKVNTLDILSGHFKVEKKDMKRVIRDTRKNNNLEIKKKMELDEIQPVLTLRTKVVGDETDAKPRRKKKTQWTF